MIFRYKRIAISASDTAYIFGVFFNIICPQVSYDWTISLDNSILANITIIVTISRQFSINFSHVSSFRFYHVYD